MKADFPSSGGAYKSCSIGGASTAVSRLNHLDDASTHVAAVYQMDERKAFADKEDKPAKALVIRQLSKAAELLRDLTYTAWVESGKPVPGMVQARIRFHRRIHSTTRRRARLLPALVRFGSIRESRVQPTLVLNSALLRAPENIGNRWPQALVLQ